MNRSLVKVLSMSLILAAFFASIISSSTFAHSTHEDRQVNTQKKALLTSYQLDCGVEMGVSNVALAYSQSGNLNGCNPSGFTYEPIVSGNNGPVGTWSYTNSTTLYSCTIQIWFPNGSLSSATKVRYDFWYGNRWISWPGHDINQNTAPAGWYTVASNLAVDDAGDALKVTAYNDGGSGNLAFAATQFTCS